MGPIRYRSSESESRLSGKLIVPERVSSLTLGVTGDPRSRPCIVVSGIPSVGVLVAIPLADDTRPGVSEILSKLSPR